MRSWASSSVVVCAGGPLRKEGEIENRVHSLELLTDAILFLAISGHVIPDHVDAHCT